jgi:hypothetical protein
MLLLDDGTVISDSAEIVKWAEGARVTPQAA